MKRLRAACTAGYERMAARAELLDYINVFPVADADTGVNLRLSLAPLRDMESANSRCLELLQHSATGNSGNIAAAFFVPLLTEQALNKSTGELQSLAPVLAEGSRLARQAVLTPKDGTMLDVFAAFAFFHDSGAHLPPGRELMDRLAARVSATARILPELRQAGVVDAGALGLFFFFEGFFAELLQDSGLCRPAQELFQGLLEPALTSEHKQDLGSCINLSLDQTDHSAVLADPAFLSTLGESVVARQDGNILRLHLHSQNPERLRQDIERLGCISQWRSEVIEAAKQDEQSPPGLFHLLCDAAGSLPRPLALKEHITLLDSYIICEGEAKPETLWQPAHIYQALRAGKKVSTAQASTYERQEHFSHTLELHGPSLYLSVGSVYTGNYANALAWKEQHDDADNFTVIDSGAASGRLACIALLASRASRRLNSKKALLAHVNWLCHNCEEYVFIDNLRYLAAGGRISKISGLAGGLLGLKPIISPQAEGVRKLGVLRSQAAQVDFALAQIKHLKHKGQIALALLQFSDNEDWVREAMLSPLQEMLPESEILMVPLSLTSGVHMGPGTWGLAVCPKFKEM